MVSWNNTQPIYLQLKEKISAAIIDGSLQEGAPLPSIRQMSGDYQVNPMTVSKAYQMLSDANIIEKRRGIGMFVSNGAQHVLLKLEREQFIATEWPTIALKIKRLGLSIGELDI